ncbi:saccharopine dehydrogenase [Aestuariicella hydrocarbonica]|uniref:Saccharopine dehydrogenase n=1 Tax=Pseudomaricurvus hydrocarbonicus TaxID=1470433 RepID=A0A9E5JTW4_9GAMM|nr:DUF5938 domain-containing protein [Aestuariicella hydrocarbonica]NHO66753.1 saccharopine dehydrogenase [Aestuariicella hydrocarbonica]
MSQERKILIYGASGYTGKLVAECLARRGLPFYMSGRTLSRLEAALDVVKKRHHGPVDVELVAASNNVEELKPLFEKVDVVINVAGPFMQVAWPIVEACLQARCHYLDTTGEQDWTRAIQAEYGQAFADKNLLLSPACSYMWAAGALTAEVVLETNGIDSLELVYQIDNALPSEASTKSFLRMQGNADSQFFLQQNEYAAWPNDRSYDVVVPHRMNPYRALPWGGACEPVWFKTDPRVRNCKVLTAFGDDIVDNVTKIIQDFNERAKGLTQQQREDLTNEIGESMAVGEPEPDTPDTGRSMVVCYGQGPQGNTTFCLSLTTPYCFTGEICAEAAERILNGQLKKSGFQSAAVAFGHRELLEVFHELGYSNSPA